MQQAMGCINTLEKIPAVHKANNQELALTVGVCGFALQEVCCSGSLM
jgi:hypothetical protein